MSRKTRPLTETDANFRPIQDSELWTTFRGDYTGTNLIFAGFARPGSAEGDLVWQIRKMTYDGSSNLTDIKYPENANAVAVADYEFSWTTRAAQIYS